MSFSLLSTYIVSNVLSVYVPVYGNIVFTISTHYITGQRMVFTDKCIVAFLSISSIFWYSNAAKINLSGVGWVLSSQYLYHFWINWWFGSLERLVPISPSWRVILMCLQDHTAKKKAPTVIWCISFDIYMCVLFKFLQDTAWERFLLFFCRVKNIIALLL